MKASGKTASPAPPLAAAVHGAGERQLRAQHVEQWIRVIAADLLAPAHLRVEVGRRQRLFDHRLRRHAGFLAPRLELFLVMIAARALCGSNQRLNVSTNTTTSRPVPRVGRVRSWK